MNGPSATTRHLLYVRMVEPFPLPTDMIATVVRPYIVEVPAESGPAYGGAVWHPLLNRLFFVPFGQSNEPLWHYVNRSGHVVAYAHGVNAVDQMYFGGTWHPLLQRIYFAPVVGNQPKWHFVDTNGTITSYNRGNIGTVTFPSYLGAVWHPHLERVYYIPFGNAQDAMWHYVNQTGDVVGYIHGSAPGPAYTDGVWHPLLERLYFAPRRQCHRMWIFVAKNGSIVQYSGASNVTTQDAYIGATWHALLERIYLVPCWDAAMSQWHYIAADGSVVAYTHRSNAEAGTYYGAVYHPFTDRLFFVPRLYNTTWHFVNNKGLVEPYDPFETAGRYSMGGYHPALDRIYLSPLEHGAQSEWHYIAFEQTTNPTRIFNVPTLLTHGTTSPNLTLTLASPVPFGRTLTAAILLSGLAAEACTVEPSTPLVFHAGASRQWFTVTAGPMSKGRLTIAVRFSGNAASLYTAPRNETLSVYWRTTGKVLSVNKISNNTGGFTFPLEGGDQFGFSLGSPGDVNNDGVADLIVGARYHHDGGNRRGGVFLLFMGFGGSALSSTKLSSPTFGFTQVVRNNDVIGFSVAGLGDLDSDGVPDVVTGSWMGHNADPPGAPRGAVFIMFLHRNGMVRSSRKISRGESGLPTNCPMRFGTSVTPFHTLECNAAKGLAVGHYIDVGYITILFLDATGWVISSKNITPASVGIANATRLFGRSIAIVRDMDGDGNSEWAVATWSGHFFLLYLDSHASVKSALIVKDRYLWNAGVSTAFDMNADGTDEVIAGAPTDNVPYLVHLQSKGDILSVAELRIAKSGPRFGSAVTAVGDINDDGVMDLAAANWPPDASFMVGDVFVISLAKPTLLVSRAPVTWLQGSSHEMDLALEMEVLTGTALRADLWLSTTKHPRTRILPSSVTFTGNTTNMTVRLYVAAGEALGSLSWNVTLGGNASEHFSIAPLPTIQVVNTNECIIETHNCHPFAICSDTNGSFTCHCHSGYSGDGLLCENNNECTNATHTCHPFANCSDTNGSFTCQCQTGFVGNGVLCDNIDECTNGTQSCPLNAECFDTLGSFQCACLPGFASLSDNTCIDVDECREANACHAKASCTNTVGSFACVCKKGFVGDGIDCLAQPPTFARNETTTAVITSVAAASAIAALSSSGGGTFNSGGLLAVQVMAASSPGTDMGQALAPINAHGFGLVGDHILPLPTGDPRSIYWRDVADCDDVSYYFRDTVAAIAVVLAVAMGVRLACVLLSCLRGREWTWPLTLHTPRWEFYLLQWQLLGLAEAAGAAAVSGCKGWSGGGIALAVVLVVLVVLAAYACHVCVPVEAKFECYGEGVTQAWRSWKTSRRGWSDGRNLMDRVCLRGEWRHDSKQSERTFVRALDPFAGSFLRWHGFMVVCSLSRPIAAGLCFAMLPPIEAMPVVVAVFALYLVVTLTTRPFISRVEAALDGWNTCATLVWLAVQTVAMHGGFENGGDAAVVLAWVQLVIVYSLLVVGILSTVYLATVVLGDLCYGGGGAGSGVGSGGQIDDTKRVSRPVSPPLNTVAADRRKHDEWDHDQQDHAEADVDLSMSPAKPRFKGPPSRSHSQGPHRPRRPEPDADLSMSPPRPRPIRQQWQGRYRDDQNESQSPRRRDHHRDKEPSPSTKAIRVLPHPPTTPPFHQPTTPPPPPPHRLPPLAPPTTVPRPPWEPAVPNTERGDGVTATMDLSAYPDDWVTEHRFIASFLPSRLPQSPMEQFHQAFMPHATTGRPSQA